MHERLKSLEIGFFIGISFLFTIFLGTTIYAVVNNIYTEPNTLEVSSGMELKADSWNKILSNINAFSGALQGAIAVPSGGVLAFNLKECPSGWLPANGNGSIAGEDIPDLRGKFIRGLNSFENGVNKLTGIDSDEDGVNRNLGDPQGDAIRNIMGSTNVAVWTNGMLSNGVISTNNDNHGSLAGGVGAAARHILTIDASREVPTGSDNRPKNIALIYCIKE